MIDETIKRIATRYGYDTTLFECDSQLDYARALSRFSIWLNHHCRWTQERNVVDVARCLVTTGLDSCCAHSEATNAAREHFEAWLDAGIKHLDDLYYVLDSPGQAAEELFKLGRQIGELQQQTDELIDKMKLLFAARREPSGAAGELDIGPQHLVTYPSEIP